MLDVLELLHLSWIWPRWVDVVWIPILLLATHRGQRITALLFGVCNIFMMRLMVELMIWFGLSQGALGVLSIGLLLRGFLYFSVVHCLYLLYAYVVRKGAPAMFMSGTVMAFMAVHGLFILVMVL